MLSHLPLPYQDIIEKSHSIINKDDNYHKSEALKSEKENKETM